MWYNVVKIRRREMREFFVVIRFKPVSGFSRFDMFSVQAETPGGAVEKTHNKYYHTAREISAYQKAVAYFKSQKPLFRWFLPDS
jgi:hypothetical protein